MAYPSVISRWAPEPPAGPRPAPPFPPALRDDVRPTGDAAGLVDVLTALRRRIPLVLAIAVAVVAAATYLMWQEEPVYTATAVLRLGDARRALTTGLETPDAPVERLASPLLSQLQLVRSRSLIGSVVDSVGLRLVPRFENFRPTSLRDVRVDVDAPPDTLHLRFGPAAYSVAGQSGRVVARYGAPVRVGGVSFAVAERPDAESATWPLVSREQAIDLVLSNLRVKPRTQTNIVDISYTARRRLVAQRVVNEIATEFQASSARSAQAQSRRRRLFLEAQLRQADSSLDHAHLALSQFRRRAQIFSSTDRVVGVQRSVARADERLEELEAQRAMYTALLAELRPGGSRDEERLRSIAGSPAIRDNPAVVQLYSQFARHRSALDSLTTGGWRRPDTDPDVQRLRELIASSEQQLVSTIGAQITWLGTQASSLDAIRRRSVASLAELSGVEADEAQLRQNVEGRRAVSDRLRDDLQRARMAEAVELGPVEVVDLAALPAGATGRLWGLKLLLAMILGLALGGAAAVVLQRRDTSIRELADVERWLQLPGLAAIPSIVSVERHRTPSWLGPRPRRAKVGKSWASVEAYRVLRTNLAFAAPGALRSLVVTSPAPSEGKTVTAANLAITFARGGARVLIADCDLRRPSQHRLFRLSPTPGVAQILRGLAHPSEAIQPTETDGLFLLPAGTGDLGAWEPLRGDRILSLLDSLVAQFDVVIIDAPPALAVADASILAAVAEGVLVVVRAGRTDRAEAQRAVQQLETVGARVMGVVLNDVELHDLPSPGAYARYAPQTATAQLVT